ncbi:hypothetical protein [Streptomyces sp. NPDC058548]|uniref:hypothetical protein n=1 Tax=Streptomyces sp. NPDC058548 TaxID=3346545 RepID=UPI0036507C7A
MTSDEIADALDAAGDSLPAAPGSGPTPRLLASSWEDAFAAYTVALTGGHLHWTGATGQRGTPVVAWRSRVETAYRLAFRWHHKREPVGNVRPSCDYPRCVAGEHLADRVIREGAAT